MKDQHDRLERTGEERGEAPRRADADAMQSAVHAQPDAETPRNPGRREFFKLAGAGAAAVAVGATSSGCAGRVVDDLPTEIRDDLEPVDQRDLLFSMVASPVLAQREKERTKAWEAAAAKRSVKSADGSPFTPVGAFKRFFFEGTKKYERNQPGWSQLDFALEEAAWGTAGWLGGMSAAGVPNQGPAYKWDQSEVREEKWEFESEQQAAEAIKTAARLYGAARCGITRNDPRWNFDPLYDIEQDRTLSWEKDFPFEPKSVIVLLVEMDYRGIRTAPSAVESGAAGQGYSEMAMVAGQLAKFLHHLGYQAVASGNDLGLCVPYAVAAGLGQEGRHGALIAPSLGPRLRICKVYTEFDFVEYDQPRDYKVTSFCTHCKRCADACPSQAISHDDARTFEPVYEGSEDPNYTWNNNPGVLKWHNDMKKCFEFWYESGSDCGSCINACPYNKPDIWHHTFTDALQPAMPGPLHWLMKEGDRVFGYGSVNDPAQVEQFWKTGRNLRNKSMNRKG